MRGTKVVDKQTVLGRITQLAKANINTLLDHAEDPGKMIDQLIRDYTNNIAQAQEKHLDGSNATTLCFNNPNYRNWLLGAVEDYTRSYEIDGIMWGSERQGAFANALGASHGGGGA